jgi:hypothetical protein
MLKHLFEEEWNTKLSLTTDENGYLSFRGFFGDYALNAEGGAATFALKKKEEAQAELQLK